MRKKIVFTIIVFIIAISFIVIGILRKEHITVFNKASVLCYSCIGIGN